MKVDIQPADLDYLPAPPGWRVVSLMRMPELVCVQLIHESLLASFPPEKIKIGDQPGWVSGSGKTVEEALADAAVRTVKSPPVLS